MFTKRFICFMLCMLYILCTVPVMTGCDKHDENNDPGGEKTSSDTSQQQKDNRESDSVSAKDDSQDNDTDSLSKHDYALVFKDREKQDFSSINYNPLKYEKKVAPYSVENDLSNIKNLEQFGSFTEKQREMLSKNGFVVTPSDKEQLFYLYETNEYLKLPSFITVDSVLQVYHIFFDYSLRTLELEKLKPALEELTGNMLDKSIILHEKIKTKKVKDQALKNIAYFAVAQKALENEIPENIPPQAMELAHEEFELILKKEGFNDSPLLGFKLDYSQFTIRGHYTRNHEFEKYFRAMMWYGLVPFSLYKQDENETVLNMEQITRALLMTYCIFLDNDQTSRADIDLWEMIYNPVTFYVGEADDLTVFDFKDLLINVYGSTPDIETLMNGERIEKLENEIEKFPEPQIKPKWITVDTPTGKQFRFMGQKYIPDSEILQKLVDPIKRPMPSGLDVMAALGSDRAYDLLVNEYNINKEWPGYTNAFETIENKFSKITGEKWRSNMYYGWLWTIKSLISPFKEGYPSFMTNKAWTDKSLNTSLGSWAELRHDTILYGKQSGAECGGGAPPQILKGYVEPNVDTYQRILWLTQYSRETLSGLNMLPDKLKNRMQYFENILDFLITCSVKELKNEELSHEEYSTIMMYGGMLEHLTTTLADGVTKWHLITSDTDKNMAVIADVHTVPGSYLEVGVGPAHQIFVVVPINGELYLTRGAVFSYYEFVNNKRLTDEEWQKIIKENKQPPQPEWIENYKEGVKDEIPVPVKPYNSGC